jgi:hypothetical protein
MRHSLERGSSPRGLGYGTRVAHYLFNVVEGAPGPHELLRARMWGVDAREPHGAALGPTDLALVYLGAPQRAFIGHVELASASHEWTPEEAQAYPGRSPGGVLLAQVEEWDPPVSMSSVLSQMRPTDKAKADFETGVVRITESEYETALAVAAATGDR